MFINVVYYFVTCKIQISSLWENIYRLAWRYEGERKRTRRQNELRNEGHCEKKKKS